MEETIEIRELLEIVIKRKWMIVITTVVAVVLGAIYSIFIVTPIYQSDTTLMVNSSKGVSTSDIVANFDLASLNLSQKLVVTYGEIVKSRIVLEQVIEKNNMEESYEQLLSKVSASPVGTTEILKISVQDMSPERAAKTTNTIADVFVKEVMRILKVNNVELIDKAIPIERPINVRNVLNIVIAFILGLMLGVVAAFVIEYMDNTIKTKEDVEKHLGLAVIGTIPEFSQAKNE